MTVSLRVDIGVSPGTNRKSCGGKDRTEVQACSKMGHSSMPKGRSSVGMGKGMDLSALDDMVVCI